jgi:hypothetical protein
MNSLTRHFRMSNHAMIASCHGQQIINNRILTIDDTVCSLISTVENRGNYKRPSSYRKYRLHQSMHRASENEYI